MAFNSFARAQSRRWLPRSFYARAALILIVPIITIQLAVALMFLQRHYEDVTVQMTANMTREIRLVRREPVLAVPLGISFIEPPARTRIRVYDLSGWPMLEQMERNFPDLVAVDLVTDRKAVHLGFADGVGLAFHRDNVTADNPHQLLVLMVGVALLMTAISFLFMRGQIRPIRRLAQAAEAFGRGQSAEYWPSGASEVRQAGTAFLEMRARIERHIEQRTLLLSGVSHDLRTPLTRMRLELELMDGPEADALLEDVRAMERIINAFLDFAQEGANDTLVSVTLKPLVARAAQEAAGREIAVDGDASVRLPVYATGLTRAVRNLVSNALRYGQTIRVSVNATPQSIVIAVEDDGPGIPESSRDTVKRPFARLDKARSNTGGNVGLGLAIVQDMARAHGGMLRLGESALGGLKAEIVLPRSDRG